METGCFIGNTAAQTPKYTFKGNWHMICLPRVCTPSGRILCMQYSL